MIVNELRFPISAWVTTASTKDYKLIDQLTKLVKSQMLVLIGDSGYRAIRTIWNTWNGHQVFVLTNTFFETSSKLKDWYNTKLKKMNFNWLYAKRKPSVEPTFSLIKELLCCFPNFQAKKCRKSLKKLNILGNQDTIGQTCA